MIDRIEAAPRDELHLVVMWDMSGAIPTIRLNGDGALSRSRSAPLRMADVM
jgi:hypothetical protein